MIPARFIMRLSPEMQKSCELLINSMRQSEFIDLAKAQMIHFQETDDLLRSILTIKQADQAVTETMPAEAAKP